MDLKTVNMDEGPADVNHIIKEIGKSKSFGILVKNWKLFGESLEVDEVELLNLDRKLKIGDVHLRSIPREILKIWRAQKGSDANRQLLRDALLKCSAQDVAEILEPPSMQTVKFMWRKKPVSLEELLGMNTVERCIETIRDQFKNISIMEPIQLLKEQVVPSKKAQLYIPRTLVCFTELDLKILTCDSIQDHVFLFKGISKLELVRASNHQAIDESGNQLDELTVKFILLECDEDYETISEKFKKPTHLIQHVNGRFFLVKSNECLDVIRPFLKIEEEIIGEDVLISRIEYLGSPCTLSIADSPGMGKSLTLMNLASKISEKFPDYIVIFIVLQEFIQQISSDVDSSASAVEELAAYCTPSHPAKLVLTEMLKSDKHRFYLFLDGYDEIVQEKLDLADSLLKQFSKLKHTKLIISTRQHYRNRVETISNQFSIKLQPFSEDNQIRFLTQFWIEEHNAKEGEVLKKFARQCLTTMEEKLTDTEKAIAGIPLICRMLAEVLGDNARRYSGLEILRVDAVKPLSFFEMYKKLVEMKLERISDPSLKDAYVRYHVYLAISMLLPFLSEDFKRLLKLQNNFKLETLYSIGLVERGPDENSTRFIHRTFAEYLLAEFIVKNLGKNKPCVHFFFKILFGVSKPPYDYTRSVVLHYPAVAYFIEMHLEEYKDTPFIEELLPFVISTSIALEDVCTAFEVCAVNDLENMFDFVTKLLYTFDIDETLKIEHFKALPHAFIKSSKNTRLLKKVLDFTKYKFKVSLDFHTMEQILRNYPRTLLHTATQEGKYNMFTYLREHYGDIARDFKFLLHECVLESATNCQSIIEEKLLIIDTLVKINPGSVKERYVSTFFDYTPLLAPNVHLSLLKSLVEHGANINDSSPWEGTVLHTQSGISNYAELVRWAFSCGFNLVDHHRSGLHGNGETPLMHWIKEFEAVDDELLKLFLQAGSDINAQDNDGDSVLFYAIKYSGSVNIVRKVLEYGASINHTNYKGENVDDIINQMRGGVFLKQAFQLISLELRQASLQQRKASLAKESRRTPNSRPTTPSTECCKIL